MTRSDIDDLLLLGGVSLTPEPFTPTAETEIQSLAQALKNPITPSRVLPASPSKQFAAAMMDTVQSPTVFTFSDMPQRVQEANSGSGATEEISGSLRDLIDSTFTRRRGDSNASTTTTSSVPSATPTPYGSDSEEAVDDEDEQLFGSIFDDNADQLHDQEQQNELEEDPGDDDDGNETATEDTDYKSPPRRTRRTSKRTCRPTAIMVEESSTIESAMTLSPDSNKNDTEASEDDDYRPEQEFRPSGNARRRRSRVKSVQLRKSRGRRQVDREVTDFHSLTDEQIATFDFKELTQLMIAANLSEEEIIEVKARRRRLKNRHSARVCSNKKRERCVELSEANKVLASRVCDLQKANGTLKQENVGLKGEIQHLRSLLAGKGIK